MSKAPPPAMMPELNEMEQALVRLLNHASDEELVVAVYSPGDGITFPAVIVPATGEVLAFLLTPPIYYDASKVH